MTSKGKILLLSQLRRARRFLSMVKCRPFTHGAIIFSAAEEALQEPHVSLRVLHSPYPLSQMVMRQSPWEAEWSWSISEAEQLPSQGA